MGELVMPAVVVMDEGQPRPAVLKTKIKDPKIEEPKTERTQEMNQLNPTRQTALEFGFVVLGTLQRNNPR
jgi:hypothetical protein